jgi:hypothetical protein
MREHSRIKTSVRNSPREIARETEHRGNEAREKAKSNVSSPIKLLIGELKYEILIKKSN